MKIIVKSTKTISFDGQLDSGDDESDSDQEHQEISKKDNKTHSSS